MLGGGRGCTYATKEDLVIQDVWLAAIHSSLQAFLFTAVPLKRQCTAESYSPTPSLCLVRQTALLSQCWVKESCLFKISSHVLLLHSGGRKNMSYHYFVTSRSLEVVSLQVVIPKRPRKSTNNIVVADIKKNLPSQESESARQ